MKVRREEFPLFKPVQNSFKKLWNFEEGMQEDGEGPPYLGPLKNCGAHPLLKGYDVLKLGYFRIVKKLIGKTIIVAIRSDRARGV